MKRYRLLLFAGMLLTTINGMTYPMLPIHVMNIGGSIFLSQMVNAIPSLVIVLTSFFWGVVTDRIGERRRIVSYSGIFGALMFFSFSSLSPLALIAARSLQSIFVSSYILVPTLVTEREDKSKGRLLGEFNTFASGGWMLGGAIGGFLYSFGVKTFFYSCGIIYLIFALIFFFVEEKKKIKEKKRFREFLKFGDMRNIILICFAALFVASGNNVMASLFPIYLKQFSVGEEMIGLIFSLSGLTTVIVASFAGRVSDTFGKKKIIILTTISYSLLWYLMGKFDSVIILSILFAIPLFAFFYPSTNGIVSEVTKNHERGRGLGLLNSFVMLGSFVGPFFGGFMSKTLTISEIYQILAIFGLLALGFCFM